MWIQVTKSGKLKAYALNTCPYAPLSVVLEFDDALYRCHFAPRLYECVHKIDKNGTRVVVIVAPQDGESVDDMVPFHICTLTRKDGVPFLSPHFSLCFLFLFFFLFVSFAPRVFREFEF